MSARNWKATTLPSGGSIFTESIFRKTAVSDKPLGNLLFYLNIFVYNMLIHDIYFFVHCKNIKLPVISVLVGKTNFHMTMPFISDDFQTKITS